MRSTLVIVTCIKLVLYLLFVANWHCFYITQVKEEVSAPIKYKNRVLPDHVEEKMG